MHKLAILVLAAMLAVACDRPMMIYNGCKGSWVKVEDGRGNALVQKLDYGLSAEVDIDGYAGSNIELLASGYELQTNYPLGSATQSVYVPREGSFLGPSQVRPWQITYLQTTDQRGGCRH